MTTLTLSEIKGKLEVWRKQYPNAHLPKEIKDPIMAVLEYHPVKLIARTLAISEPTIRSWLVRQKIPRKKPVAPSPILPIQASQPQSLPVVPQMKRSGYELEIEQGSSKTVLWFETQDLVSIFFRSITEKNPILAIKLRNKP